MRHCCKFKADDIYYLEDTDLYSHRTLSVGFCPECKCPVAELIEYRFTGAINKVSAVGMNAQNLMVSLKDEIIYSAKEVNYRKLKMKPFGWKYGINRDGQNGSIKQYACDFYGNKELIKKVIKK